MGAARPLLALAVLGASVAAAPGRHVAYAESADRLVYVVVFGSKDTCRVVRRKSQPQGAFADYARRPPDAAGDTVIAEFDFGRSGRPIHIVPTNDGKFLLALANRAPDGGRPAEDRVYHLAEKDYSERLDYGTTLPDTGEPLWPAHPRMLAPASRHPAPASSAVYAFLARETAPGRIVVARRSETEDGAVDEIVCFRVEPATGKVTLPEPAELTPLLTDAEALFRAAAAGALGRLGRRDDAAAVRATLSRAEVGAERAVIAEALVRCGDRTGWKTLYAVLAHDEQAPARREAARALLRLPPDGLDPAELAAVACADTDAVVARLVGVALARLGHAAVAETLKQSRSGKPAVRAAAAAVLGHLPDAKAEERLVQLARDPHEEVMTAAAIALTRPPRRLLESSWPEFARALRACGKARNRRASSRLAKLAAHARIRDADVLDALIELASFHEEAIRSLQRLTGERFLTVDDWRRWQKEKGR